MLVNGAGDLPEDCHLQTQTWPWMHQERSVLGTVPARSAPAKKP